MNVDDNNVDNGYLVRHLPLTVGHDFYNKHFIEAGDKTYNPITCILHHIYIYNK